MKEINYDFFNTKLYYEKLNNGLEIYIIPNNKVKDIYVTLNVKYGGLNFPFKLNNKYRNVPNGIAHFLEHKLFEQENGIDPMTYYSTNGADCNASTSYKVTSYMFSCVNNYKNNLKYLLNYVTHPYFTDINVEKEKGIITEEIKMYDDIPNRYIYDKLMNNIIIKHPIKHSIAGKIEDINRITPNDLYDCYNTFYTYNNMFMIITGNVEPLDTIKLLKKYDNKTKNKKITIKNIKEPNKIYKKKEIIQDQNTKIPLVLHGFKIQTNNDIELRKLKYYYYTIFETLFDKTSLFYEKALEDKLLTSPMILSMDNIDNYLIISLNFKSKKYNEVIKRINNQLKNINITIEDIERKKRVYIGNTYYVFDSIYATNNFIINNIINYNNVYNNIYEIINSMNINELSHIISHTDFTKTSTVIIKNVK